MRLVRRSRLTRAQAENAELRAVIRRACDALRTHAEGTAYEPRFFHDIRIVALFDTEEET